ncbi:MAG: hypothetical protein JRI52_09400 [Deltaproteobacteria bacterium]|nr:hypothetical protein [Deltaproteobacteria bacterium]
MEGENELILTGYFTETGDKDREEKVQEIKEHCGWDLKIADDLQPIDPPTEEELMIIRLCDPHGYFLGRRTS